MDTWEPCIPRLTDEEGNPTSTGEAQFEACMELLEEWEVNEDVTGITFDTTSSNTGRIRGACTRLEGDYFEKKVFWFGCRHHVPELIAKAVWYFIFDADQGPDSKAYQQVKDVWSDLDYSPTALTKKLAVRSPFLQKLKSAAIDFYMNF